MKSFSAPLVALAVLVAGVTAQTFTINTPNPPVQCVATQFTWTGGTEPYFLSLPLVGVPPYLKRLRITPGGVVGAAALQQYSGLTGTSFTWSTNISAGTSIGLSLTDSTGSTVQSAPVTIQSGPSSSCLDGTASSGTGSTTSAGSTGTTSASTPAGTTTGTSAGTSAGSSGTTSKSSSTGTGTGTATAGSASNTESSAAGAIVASTGLLGVLGAVAAAILA